MTVGTGRTTNVVIVHPRYRRWVIPGLLLGLLLMVAYAAVLR